MTSHWSFVELFEPQLFKEESLPTTKRPLYNNNPFKEENEDAFATGSWSRVCISKNSGRVCFSWRRTSIKSNLTVEMSIESYWFCPKSVSLYSRESKLAALLEWPALYSILK